MEKVQPQAKAKLNFFENGTSDSRNSKYSLAGNKLPSFRSVEIIFLANEMLELFWRANHREPHYYLGKLFSRLLVGRFFFILELDKTQKTISQFFSPTIFRKHCT